jgi:integrase
VPALVLDATGMRIGELEALTWGDLDGRGSGGVQALATRATIAATDAIARLIEARFDAYPQRL